MFFLGVDGGGTRTDFALIDTSGQIRGRATKGGTHYLQVERSTVLNTLESGVDEVCQQAGISREDLAYSFLGLPCYGEQEDSVPTLEGIVGEILPRDSFECSNDVEAGWAGSLACRPGIHLVAGTGAIGFGRDPQGQTARASGWDHFCGDEGSAYWLAREFLSLFCKESDGRRPRTPLYTVVREELHLNRDLDLIDILHGQLELQRDRIAALARLVYRSAQRGDTPAIELYGRAAREHSLTVRALIDKLDFGQRTVPVSYSGGVFNAGGYILRPLEDVLSDMDRDVELHSPLLQPATGAALYALKKKHGDIGPGLVETLQREEQ